MISISICQMPNVVPGIDSFLSPPVTMAQWTVHGHSYTIDPIPRYSLVNNHLHRHPTSNSFQDWHISCTPSPFWQCCVHISRPFRRFVVVLVGASRRWLGRHRFFRGGHFVGSGIVCLGNCSVDRCFWLWLLWILADLSQWYLHYSL